MNAVVPVGFALLALALAASLARLRVSWQARLALIVVVPAFAFASWAALDSYRGWPSVRAVPARALLVSGYAVEPDPASGSAGAVYLWLIPARYGHGRTSYEPARDEPRSYRLPYSRSVEEQLARAQAQQKKGGQVEVTKGKGHGHGRRGGSRGNLRFAKLPPPKLPSKDK